jgi:C-terminal processing protease CtpA/Prc
MFFNPLTDPTGSHRNLGDRIGMLQLRDLRSSTTITAVRQLIRRLGPVDGIILDLRDAVGDNFYVAVNLVPLFMSSGIIWSYGKAARNGAVSSTISLTDKQLVWEGVYPRRATRRSAWDRIEKMSPAAPVLLLVNGTDSLAVQVIAHALKQNHAARVWGTATCGRAPASFVGVNNGNFQRLVHCQTIRNNGDRQQTVIEEVAPCLPDREVNFRRWDERPIIEAKQELQRLISRMVPVVQDQPRSNAS